MHSKQFDNRLSWVWGQLIEACHQTGRTDDFYALIVAHIQFGRGQESAVDLANILQSRAIDLMAAADFGSAETLLRECLELRQREDADSWKSSVTRYWLGRVLKSRQKLAEAETLLWSAATELNQKRNTLGVKHKTLVEESIDEWFGTREAMKLSFVNTLTTQE